MSHDVATGCSRLQRQGGRYSNLKVDPSTASRHVFTIHSLSTAEVNFNFLHMRKSKTRRLFARFPKFPVHS